MDDDRNSWRYCSGGGWVVTGSGSPGSDAVACTGTAASVDTDAAGADYGVHHHSGFGVMLAAIVSTKRTVLWAMNSECDDLSAAGWQKILHVGHTETCAAICQVKPTKLSL